MKKKTKVILSIVAAVILVLGLVVYEAASLYYPLKYDDGYVPKIASISQQEIKESEAEEFRLAYFDMREKFGADVVLTNEQTYSVDELILAEGTDISEEEIHDIFRLTEKKETTPYGKEDSAFELSGYMFAFFNNIGGASSKENKDGSKEFEILLTDEMCYFTGLMTYEVVPDVHSFSFNMRILGFYGVNSDKAEEKTSSVRVREADILFPGTVVRGTMDKDGRITYISAEIPIECEAKLMTGLFTREDCTLKLTKTITQSIEYV